MHIIDTHILLWLLSAPEKLSERAKRILQEDDLCVSMASLWEIAIKQSNGKLELPFSPNELYAICIERDIKVKHIQPRHLTRLLTLPKVHNDPFDRLIICQDRIAKVPHRTHRRRIYCCTGAGDRRTSTRTCYACMYALYGLSAEEIATVVGK